MQSTEIWEELVVFLGERALNIELGVPVFRVKDETERCQEAKLKVLRCGAGSRDSLCRQ